MRPATSAGRCCASTAGSSAVRPLHPSRRPSSPAMPVRRHSSAKGESAGPLSTPDRYESSSFDVPAELGQPLVTRQHATLATLAFAVLGFSIGQSSFIPAVGHLARELDV